MRSGTPGLLCLAAVLLAAVGAAPLAAQEPEWTEISLQRQAHEIESLRVEISYAVGEMRVFPARRGLLYEANLRYDARLFRPRRTWAVDDGVGRLTIGLEDGDIHWREFRSGEKGRGGRLSLGLSREIETELAIEVGAAESRLQLGGIALRGLKLETGASRTSVSFDEPNPVVLRHLEIAAGAAELEIHGLGNARLAHLKLEGALGDVHLDFGGAWTADATAEIAVGLGALHLTFPHGLGVEIRKDGFFAAFDRTGFVRADDAYRTANWDSADHHLRIDLEAVVGTVDVEFAD